MALLRSLAGEYSGVGATTCTDCPAGQYNPSPGLGDQTLVGSNIKCLRCPKGSIALADGESIDNFLGEDTLSAKAITCDAW